MDTSVLGAEEGGFGFSCSSHLRVFQVGLEHDRNRPQFSFLMSVVKVKKVVYLFRATVFSLEEIKWTVRNESCVGNKHVRTYFNQVIWYLVNLIHKNTMTSVLHTYSTRLSHFFVWKNRTQFFFWRCVYFPILCWVGVVRTGSVSIHIFSRHYAFWKTCDFW